jgi:heterotetrameric sarcosine oxidase delta subunit
LRITCPYCGTRGNEEFTYLGDATVKRPNASAADAEDEFFDYVYLRDNPSGPHRELWYHTGGCRSWLVVTRNTRTHEISAVELAQDGGKA